VPPEESLIQFIGPPLGTVFERVLRTDDRDLIQSAVDAYRERFAAVGFLESHVYHGIPGVLASLQTLGIAMHVVTSKPAEYAERIVRHHGLDRYVADVFGPPLSALYESKGALIRRALSTGRIETEGVMMVGDRKEDVAGEQENGIGSVGVTWGYGSREELVGADRVIDSPSELVELVGQAPR
jgi:phosphoglycolate phosphatase